jgi:hypothetical protein
MGLLKDIGIIAAILIGVGVFGFLMLALAESGRYDRW